MLVDGRLIQTKQRREQIVADRLTGMRADLDALCVQLAQLAFDLDAAFTTKRSEVVVERAP